jgi:dTDP-4-amino-4,6-dideoxygalactose transaminase
VNHSDDDATSARHGIRYARKRLDLSPRDVARGLALCVRSRARDDLAAAATAAWSPSEAVVVTLSVRSGFDLLLAAVDWPPGSEVVFSAVTIPHLATLVRGHGYVPVPVDVSADTLEMDPVELQAACTERTRAVVIAQLFGTRSDLTAVASLATARGLLLIEDCAQSYDGTHRQLGVADLEMYSFGTIKTATCLGGGVLLVRDAALRARIRMKQYRYPIQPTGEYVRKLWKAALLLAVSTPNLYQLFNATLRILDIDQDRLIRTISREFDDRDLLTRIRRQPGRALLAMMVFRFDRYRPGRVIARRQAGERLASKLAPHVVILGCHARSSTHWLFPIVSRAPQTLIAAGRHAGFDLTTGSSTLVAFDQTCPRATHAMTNVVYVPIHATMPPAAISELACAINHAERH